MTFVELKTNFCLICQSYRYGTMLYTVPRWNCNSVYERTGLMRMSHQARSSLISNSRSRVHVTHGCCCSTRRRHSSWHGHRSMRCCCSRRSSTTGSRAPGRCTYRRRRRRQVPVRPWQGSFPPSVPSVPFSLTFLLSVHI